MWSLLQNDLIFMVSYVFIQSPRPHQSFSAWIQIALWRLPRLSSVCHALKKKVQMMYLYDLWGHHNTLPRHLNESLKKKNFLSLRLPQRITTMCVWASDLQSLNSNKCLEKGGGVWKHNSHSTQTLWVAIDALKISKKRVLEPWRRGKMMKSDGVKHPYS